MQNIQNITTGEEWRAWLQQHFDVEKEAWLVPNILFRIVPVGSVAVEIRIKLSCLHFSFLHTKEIGVQLLETFLKLLFVTGL